MKSRWSIVFAVLLFAGAASGFEPKDTVKAHCRAPQERKADCSSFKPEKPARNVIVVINDGLGINEIYATRVFKNGPDQPLSFEKFPHHSLVKTCALNGVTDSAAAATAMATGNKTLNTRIGKDSKGEDLVNAVELAKKSGRAVGIVTTDELAGATPAGFSVHSRSRNSYEQISEAYLELKPDLLMGGGRKWFAPESAGSGDETIIHTAGGKTVKVKQEPGSKNLLLKARDLGYTIVIDKDGLDSLPADAKSVLGLFAASDLDFDAERPADSPEPSMEQMMTAALKFLSKNPNGFLLVFESARSDSADHGTDIKRLIPELMAVERAVDRAIEFQKKNPDTLILLTSDHDTGGLEVKPGDYKKGDYVQGRWTAQLIPGLHAMHSGQKVGLFGQGPGSELVEKADDNTQVFCIISGAIQ